MLINVAIISARYLVCLIWIDLDFDAEPRCICNVLYNYLYYFMKLFIGGVDIEHLSHIIETLGQVIL